ncbi:MAG: endonuclease/exonuclease/phosphatase family protein [Acidimicrobiia bacterium]
MTTGAAVRAAAVVVALVAAACTNGDGDSDGASQPENGSQPEAQAEEVRVVTLNVLHGLFCPPETDYCHAPDRAELVARGLEEASCPELVGLQEIGPRQGELIPEAAEQVCGGSYEVAWQAVDSPDRAMVLTTLPITDRGYLDLAAFPWEAYWVRATSPVGPVDFLTTHFASSANNPPCTAENCPPVCSAGVDANQCNALEVADFFDARPEATLQIASGDFNATPDDPTLVTFTDAGFVDAWLAAGEAECDAATGKGCTGGRSRPDNPLDGLDVPDGRYSARIDFVLAKAAPDCSLDAEAEGFFAEPFAEPYRGLYWASDHAGVLATLRCA